MIQKVAKMPIQHKGQVAWTTIEKSFANAYNPLMGKSLYSKQEIKESWQPKGIYKNYSNKPNIVRWQVAPFIFKHLFGGQHHDQSVIYMLQK
jgi:hypothetical protein